MNDDILRPDFYTQLKRLPEVLLDHRFQLNALSRSLYSLLALPPLPKLLPANYLMFAVIIYKLYFLKRCIPPKQIMQMYEHISQGTK